MKVVELFSSTMVGLVIVIAMVIASANAENVTQQAVNETTTQRPLAPSCNGKLNVNKAVVCYYSGQSTAPDKLDPCTCTHLVLTGWTVDEDLQLTNPTFANLSFVDRLKEQNTALVIVLSVGTGSGSDLSYLTNSSERVVNFTSNIVSFLDDSEQRVDGVELDMAMTQVEQRDQHIRLLKSLRTAFDNVSSASEVNATTAADRKYLLATTISTDPEAIVRAYDLTNISRLVDYAFLPAYNFTLDEATSVFHHSRLMGISDMVNADSMVDLLVSLGLNEEKLVLGVPAFGVAFTLLNANETSVRSKTTGQPTRTIPYKQVCHHIESDEGWTVERDDDQTGVRAFKGTAWIGYDDSLSIRIKSKYVLLRNLAGVGLRGLDDDDASGRCEGRRFPLATAARDTLASLGGAPQRAVMESMEEDLEPVNATATTTSTTPLAETTVAPGVREKRSSVYRVTQIVDRRGSIHLVGPGERPRLGCSRQGYYRHPEDCGRFYRCVKFDQYREEFTVFEYDCPSGLVFDERHSVCNWPSAAPPCDGSGEIFSVPASTFVCRAPGYFRDPDNCRWFYKCSDFYGDGALVAFEFRCPYDLVFDEQRLLCNWRWLTAPCQGRGGYSAGIHHGRAGPYASAYAPGNTYGQHRPAFGINTAYGGQYDGGRRGASDGGSYAVAGQADGNRYGSNQVGQTGYDGSGFTVIVPSAPATRVLGPTGSTGSGYQTGSYLGPNQYPQQVSGGRAYNAQPDLLTFYDPGSTHTTAYVPVGNVQSTGQYGPSSGDGYADRQNYAPVTTPVSQTYTFNQYGQTPISDYGLSKIPVFSVTQQTPTYQHSGYGRAPSGNYGQSVTGSIYGSSYGQTTPAVKFIQQVSGIHYGQTSPGYGQGPSVTSSGYGQDTRQGSAYGQEISGNRHQSQNAYGNVQGVVISKYGPSSTPPSTGGSYRQEASGYGKAATGNEYGPSTQPSSYQQVSGYGKDASGHGKVAASNNYGPSTPSGGYQQEVSGYGKDASGYGKVAVSDNYGPSTPSNTYRQEVSGYGKVAVSNNYGPSTPSSGYRQEVSGYGKFASGHGKVTASNNYGPSTPSGGYQQEVSGYGKDASGYGKVAVSGNYGPSTPSNTYRQEVSGYGKVAVSNNYGPSTPSSGYRQEVSGYGKDASGHGKVVVNNNYGPSAPSSGYRQEVSGYGKAVVSDNYGPSTPSSGYRQEVSGYGKDASGHGKVAVSNNYGPSAPSGSYQQDVSGYGKAVVSDNYGSSTPSSGYRQVSGYGKDASGYGKVAISDSNGPSTPSSIYRQEVSGYGKASLGNNYGQSAPSGSYRQDASGGNNYGPSTPSSRYQQVVSGYGKGAVSSDYGPSTPSNSYRQEESGESGSNYGPSTPVGSYGQDLPGYTKFAVSNNYGLSTPSSIYRHEVSGVGKAVLGPSKPGSRYVQASGSHQESGTGNYGSSTPSSIYKHDIFGTGKVTISYNYGPSTLGSSSGYGQAEAGNYYGPSTPSSGYTQEVLGYGKDTSNNNYGQSTPSSIYRQEVSGYGKEAASPASKPMNVYVHASGNSGNPQVLDTYSYGPSTPGSNYQHEVYGYGKATGGRDYGSSKYGGTYGQDLSGYGKVATGDSYGPSTPSGTYRQEVSGYSKAALGPSKPAGNSYAQASGNHQELDIDSYGPSTPSSSGQGDASNNYGPSAPGGTRYYQGVSRNVFLQPGFGYGSGQSVSSGDHGQAGYGQAASKSQSSSGQTVPASQYGQSVTGNSYSQSVSGNVGYGQAAPGGGYSYGHTISGTAYGATPSVSNYGQTSSGSSYGQTASGDGYGSQGHTRVTQSYGQTTSYVTLNNYGQSNGGQNIRKTNYEQKKGEQGGQQYGYNIALGGSNRPYQPVTNVPVTLQSPLPVTKDIYATTPSPLSYEVLGGGAGHSLHSSTYRTIEAPAQSYGPGIRVVTGGESGYSSQHGGADDQSRGEYYGFSTSSPRPGTYYHSSTPSSSAVTLPQVTRYESVTVTPTTYAPHKAANRGRYGSSGDYSYTSFYSPIHKGQTSLVTPAPSGYQTYGFNSGGQHYVSNPTTSAAFRPVYGIRNDGDDGGRGSDSGESGEEGGHADGGHQAGTGQGQYVDGGNTYSEEGQIRVTLPGTQQVYRGAVRFGHGDSSSGRKAYSVSYDTSVERQRHRSGASGTRTQSSYGIGANGDGQYDTKDDEDSGASGKGYSGSSSISSSSSSSSSSNGGRHQESSGHFGRGASYVSGPSATGQYNSVEETRPSSRERGSGQAGHSTYVGPIQCERAGLFRHPDDCNKFYECYWDKWVNGFTLHYFDCPVRLVYDETISGCSWPGSGPVCNASGNRYARKS